MVIAIFTMYSICLLLDLRLIPISISSFITFPTINSYTFVCIVEAHVRNWFTLLEGVTSKLIVDCYMMYGTRTTCFMNKRHGNSNCTRGILIRKQQLVLWSIGHNLKSVKEGCHHVFF